MKLPWQYVKLAGHSFNTSITDAEHKRLVELAKGRSVIEVGTAYGYSACAMATGGARFVLSVDPHHGYGAMSGSLSYAINAVREMGLEDTVSLAVAKSNDFLSKLLTADAKFDMAFIDGDHRFDSVAHDLDYCWELLRPGGWLAVHDFGEETCPDVKDAVQTMFDTYTLEQAILTDTLWTVVKVV